MTRGVDSFDGDGGGLTRPSMRRRRFLASSFAVGSGILAGCLGDDGDSGPDLATQREFGFEEFSTGSVPDDFVLVGNESQGVTDETAASGEQSYRMQGSHGGCWMSIARFSAVDERPAEEPVRLEGAYRLGEGEVGCHNGSGNLKLITEPSSSEFGPSREQVLQFNPDGQVTSLGTEVGSFEPGEWVTFSVMYRPDEGENEIAYECTIGDGDAVTATRERREYESELTAIELTSGDFTVFWDDFAIQTTEGGGEQVDLSFDVTHEDAVVSRYPTITADISGADAISEAEVALQADPGYTIEGTQQTSTSYEFPFPDVATRLGSYPYELTASTPGGASATYEDTLVTEPEIFESEAYYSMVYHIGDELREITDLEELIVDEIAGDVVERATAEGMRRILGVLGAAAPEQTAAVVGQFVGLTMGVIANSEFGGGPRTQGDLWVLTNDGLQTEVTMGPGGAIEPAFHVYQGATIGDIYLTITPANEDRIINERLVVEGQYPTLQVGNRRVWQLSFLTAPFVFTPDGDVDEEGNVVYPDYELQLILENANGSRTVMDSVPITVEA